MQIELPFPPSANHLWRRFGHRTILSRGGREFRRSVAALLAANRMKPIEGRLAVIVDVHPPDRRRRDLDNLQKSLLDALQHGGLYRDDAQIDDLHIRRRGVVPGGMVRVQVKRRRESSLKKGSQAKPRACLKCDEVFDSSGPGNRICSSCQRSNAKLRIDESELQKQRGLKRHNGEILPADVEAMN